MRKILFILIAILIALAGTVSAAQTEANVVKFNIVMNNEPQIIRNSMIAINGRTYLPVREMAELLNLYVVWDDENKIIKISDINVVKDEKHKDVLLNTDIVNADITDFRVQVEGYVWQLENPVVVIDGTSYLPLRELGQLFHLTVDWIEDSKTIILEKEENKSEDELLLPFKEDGLWGYMDENGKVVISPQYTWASDFSEGLAEVRNQEGYVGYIDQEGNTVIAHMYSNGHSFSEGLAYAEQRGEADGLKSCYIDKNGNSIIVDSFREAGDFHDGFAVVSKGDGHWAYMNKKGEYVYEKGEYLEPFKNGYAVAEDRYGYKKILNTKFEVLTDEGAYTDAFVVYGEDGIGELAVVQNHDEKYGLIDFQGKIIIPFEYDYLDVNLEEGFMIAQKDGKTGVIDFFNQIMIDFCYDFLGGYGEGMFVYANIFTDNPGVGFIDSNGEIVIAPDYVEAEGFVNGTAIAYTQVDENQDTLVIIDKKGNRLKEFIIEGVYFLERYPNGIIRIDKQDSCYYFNSKGEEIFPVK